MVSAHWGALLYLSIVVSAAASWLQASGQQRVPPHEAAVIYTLDPVSTAKAHSNAQRATAVGAQLATAVSAKCPLTPWHCALLLLSGLRRSLRLAAIR